MTRLMQSLHGAIANRSRKYPQDGESQVTSSDQSRVKVRDDGHQAVSSNGSASGSGRMTPSRSASTTSSSSVGHGKSLDVPSNNETGVGGTMGQAIGASRSSSSGSGSGGESVSRAASSPTNFGVAAAVGDANASGSRALSFSMPSGATSRASDAQKSRFVSHAQENDESVGPHGAMSAVGRDRSDSEAAEELERRLNERLSQAISNKAPVVHSPEQHSAAPVVSAPHLDVNVFPFKCIFDCCSVHFHKN